ncbi:NAD(P)-dependent alcohol dehydrogenase [Streptomyces sp. GbtcB7]|uniref:NAD(P)-dependent alcohol dehydrogenase n=1 Tax=Streptomyces sp. GbtcB7 TaxID=2824752 RepID=UPI001C3026E4|nr:NAD(P)-dependent alcohol dehydrogenase [Streptomyces sp. GbtcB7]
MRIRAAVVEEKDKPFILEELELDEPRPDEVLVRIVATGVCQTDAHVQHQNLPTPLPVVPGHEGAGVVEAVGSTVTSLVPGDHVVLSYQSCGRCGTCLSGHPAYCDLAGEVNFAGRRADGTTGVHRPDGVPGGGEVGGRFFGQSSFATHALVTERNAVKVPDDVPLELLGPLGCGLQTGAASILTTFEVEAGSSVAVFGSGAVGLSAVMAARVAGAATIIAVDINAERLELAAELGATHVVNGREADVSEEIRRITGRGVDYVLENTGHPDMLGHATASLAPMGTVGLLNSPPGSNAPIDGSRLTLGSTVRGIIQGDAVPHTFIPKLIAMYREGTFPFDRLIRFYDFEDINEAFADAQKGLAIKPVLRVSQP